jgi:hypothetical protein
MSSGHSAAAYYPKAMRDTGVVAHASSIRKNAGQEHIK